MQKTILIVDDQAINRTILKKLLCDEYEILEAEDGKVALRLLNQHSSSISAVLLDLIMPEMDGYAVLEAMSREAELSAIPVIVASQMDKSETEGKALQLGARDFIAKPYNPVVLRKRLANLIELYESNVNLLQVERDMLTGLYNKDAFYRRASSILQSGSDQSYTLIVTDIERFKLVNDCFGTAAGDELLRYVARQLAYNMGLQRGLCARINSDHFVALVPVVFTEETFRPIVQKAEEELSVYPLNMKISLKFGVYPVTERELPISLMCDRALLVADGVKGQYQCICSFYDDTIRQRMLREQEISNEMNKAIEEDQFLVFLQPKYDIRNDYLVGAEALVRWDHPTLGFMNPGEFIPIFERNGFIAELDRYIWDKACEIIERWIVTEKKYVPVSVNVSRKDIYQEDLPDILSGIVKKHGLRPNQLHLEITETAYTENAEQLIAVVSKLKQMGFIIEMDDFGNGYSSLNMLSELPIDVLKLDMRFIQRESKENSSRSILSFIISLAKWMNLLVIAEGVESQSQVELLRNMDCNYVQGYYYAKPMPVSQFSGLLTSACLAPATVGEQKDWMKGTLQVNEKTGDKVMLIIDDVELNRTVLAEYFKDIYTIVEADNGQIAHQYIEEHYDEIAVIMLDLIMPVMDGFQLLELLKETPRFASIPVIVTSQAGEVSEVHAFELGASDFLGKPYNLDIALHRVQNVTARNAIQTLEREKRMLSKMKQLALEAKLDQMTGVYNRMEMERQVQDFFVTNEQKDSIFLMLDIDNFKSINDQFDHIRGDETIKAVANALQSYFREDDLVCRMGGDEFAVFIRSKLEKSQLSRRLDQISAKLKLQIEDMEVTCSIGVCVAPEDGACYQDVYQNADVALLMAKRLGKNRWQIYGGEARLPDQVLHRNMDWLLDESSDAIIVSDAQTYEIYYLNDVACALAGKDKKTCLSMPCYQALWNNDAPCSHCVHISKLTRDYCEHEVQSEETGKNYIIKGKLFTWGTHEARIQYIQDNTLRYHMSQQMNALLEDQQTLLDLLPSGLIRYSARTQEFTFVSKNTLRMLGYTQQEFEEKFKNRFDLMVWHEDRERVLLEIAEQISHSSDDTCEYRIEKKDGTLCWVYDIGHLHPNRNGGEFYVTFIDATRQKTLEQENEQLRLAQGKTC
ncbi:MAG: EAL domain-containing protein [Eubacteriales bacterium]|nr:EAL domain-containing protein [Eubacteriales bacterium]